MNEKINTKPISYEDWIDLGRVIIPCLKGTPEVKDWSNPDFKITKEEWKQKYEHCEIALRLDQDTDFDIDNPIVRRFTDSYLKNKDCIFGRYSNPTSHYVWNESLKFKQFILPKELENYCAKFPHGNTLCEIRSDAKHYTIVPESQHSKANEIVQWEVYEGFKKYPGDLKLDLGKIALSTALCILYPSTGSRDPYCTAIAGVLVKHTKWTEEEINEFVYNIAVAANDDEQNLRNKKGTTVKKANHKYGIPKLAELIGCEQKSVSELFTWIGINENANGLSQQYIGDIIEYGSNRFDVIVHSSFDGQTKNKIVTMDGQTLRNKKLFYNAIISKASVWLPEMKDKDFDDIMRLKFDSRLISKDYVEEADEDLVFKKNFNNYIKETKAYTNKIELANYGFPYYNQKRAQLEFDLDSFEDYLHKQRVNMQRVDLVLNVQRILKAKKIKGKVDNKSCVSWRVFNYELERENLIIEGEAQDITETKEITYDS